MAMTDQTPTTLASLYGSQMILCTLVRSPARIQCVFVNSFVKKIVEAYIILKRKKTTTENYKKIYKMKSRNFLFKNSSMLCYRCLYRKLVQIEETHRECYYQLKILNTSIPNCQQTFSPFFPYIWKHEFFFKKDMSQKCCHDV